MVIEFMCKHILKLWSNSLKIFTWILNIARNAAIDYTRSKKFKQSKQNLNSDFFVDILESSDNLDDSTAAIGVRVWRCHRRP
jgi:DNA-directed RNA polymerase specialized sigma24 family protein